MINLYWNVVKRHRWWKDFQGIVKTFDNEKDAEDYVMKHRCPDRLSYYCVEKDFE